MPLFARLSRLKIAEKLPIYIVGAGLLVGLSIGISTYMSAATSLEQARRDQLATALAGKRATLRSYLEGIENDLTNLASSTMTRSALSWFSEAWEELGEQPTEELQRIYITENPHPTGQKENLDAGTDGSSYSDTHSLYHPWFRGFLRARGYYDIFLFDADGNLIYTVFKELDYATNLVTGKWRNSDLGNAFRAARDNPVSGHKAFYDFKPYGPSHGAPASFISTPVLDEDGELLGVLAFQMPIERLDGILQNADGLGETGETYLVGDDYLMRSDSRFAEESTILARRVEIDAVRSAIAGDQGIIADIDADGRSIIAAFEPFDFEGTRWAMIAQMATSEIMEPVKQLAWQIVLVGMVVGAILLMLGFLMGRSISRPLQTIVQTIKELAKGNHAEIHGEERADEIGDLTRAMRHVYEKGVEAARLRSALDSCSTMVVMANLRGTIVYANPAVLTYLERFETDIGQEVKGFNARSLVGSDLSQLHPSLGQAGSGTKASSASKNATEVTFGSRRLMVDIGRVVNGAGETIGTVVELTDATSDLAMQAEFARIIDAARGGDFDCQIDLAGVDGVYRELGDGMNQLTRLVTRVTDDLGAMLEAMASGDLRSRVEADYQGKLGQLKDHANRTADELTRIVSEIQGSASEVRNAASEITSGTEDLSQRTEQAASNLEETAASSEEMAATVRQNAENAKNARQLAGNADQSAKTGGDVVEQAINAMSGIEESARKITDIIGVIDEIAFQTNLLALNASVEAARAGEAGKGFAVVAQEVRQLAQRAAQAAADIKTLIQNSNGQVEDGVHLVNQAGEALTKILGSIGQVNGIVEEISNASQEQAAGVQEINGSIASLDEVTQQNSALVEQSTAAARTLGDQSTKLTELLAFFRFDDARTNVQQRHSMSTKRSVKPTAKPSLVSAGGNDDWSEF